MEVIQIMLLFMGAEAVVPPPSSSSMSISPLGEFFPIANISTDNDLGVLLQLNF